MLPAGSCTVRSEASPADPSPTITGLPRGRGTPAKETPQHRVVDDHGLGVVAHSLPRTTTAALTRCRAARAPSLRRPSPHGRPCWPTRVLAFPWTGFGRGLRAVGRRRRRGGPPPLTVSGMGAAKVPYPRVLQGIPTRLGDGGGSVGPASSATHRRPHDSISQLGRAVQTPMNTPGRRFFRRSRSHGPVMPATVRSGATSQEMVTAHTAGTRHLRCWTRPGRRQDPRWAR
jgi:hypothetical protein